jgi:hypothetical protein
MKQKRSLNISILIIILIAAIGAVVYYYSDQRTTTPSNNSQPVSALEKNGPPASPDQENIEPGASQTSLKPTQSNRDQGSVSRPPADGRPSLEPSDTSEALGLKTPPRSADQKENGVITGTIKQPAKLTSGETNPDSSESGHFYPFSAPFAVSDPPKPGEEGFCDAVEGEMDELISYLDKKSYTNLNSKVRIRHRLNEVTAALSASSPAPAGENLDPTVLFNNIYHIYRILNIDDIRIIKNILRHERNDIEFFMQILYRWLSFSDQCPKSNLIRPSEQILYLYAGFFVNTLGGRAILFRRDPLFRILFTYYCVLIIHDADREKRNTYGINLVPIIDPLKKQVGYHPELIYRDHYLSVLDKITFYYRKNR